MLVATGLLVAAVVVFACLRQKAEERVSPLDTPTTQANPHASNAKHPTEVARIIERLSEIPVTASADEIIALLGLPKDWNGGSVSSTHCCMTWDISTGYCFVLSVAPVAKDGKWALEFREAGFQAQGKPGFPPPEYHTIYPYHTWRGMQYK
jgi:hypothetical protein